MIEEKIKKKQLKASKLPEKVPINDDDSIEMKDSLNSTSMKPLIPLPEKVMQNGRTLNTKKESSDELRAIVNNNNLGTGLAGEMLKRLTYSKNHHDSSYYYYVNEIFQKICIDIIVECVSELNKNSHDADWREVSKWIMDFLINPLDDENARKMQFRLMRIIDAKIILALLHSKIQCDYVVSKICVIKLTKCDNKVTGLQHQIIRSFVINNN